jgi:hypothetical protein
MDVASGVIAPDRRRPYGSPNVKPHIHLRLSAVLASPSPRALTGENGQAERTDAPAGALSLIEGQTDEVGVTITNRTWFNVKFTLGLGVLSRAYALRPAESFSGRDLGGLRIAYHDGRGWSSQVLKSGQHYQFVERAGLFLLEKTW